MDRVADQKSLIESLIRRLQRCLEEQGVQADVQLTDHEGIVAARSVQGTAVRVTVFVTDRELSPRGTGAITNEVARARRSTIAMQPSLAQRAAGSAPGVRPGIAVVQKAVVVPKKEIRATSMADFQAQVESLPEEPQGDGSCQLVKRKRGNIWTAQCGGSCPDGGPCSLTTGVDRGVIFSRCDCR
jgi:hypothetical protein